MGQLFIHIGSQKTGSTSIQTFLRNNPEKLAAQGINYVSAGRGPSAHNRVATQLKTNPAIADNMLENIVSEIRAKPDMTHILSSEMFFNRGWAKKFKRVLPNDIRAKTRVIAYIRRQDKFVESMYKQVLKTGRFQGTPKDYIAKKLRSLDYTKTLAPFERTFGADKIDLCPYERGYFPSGDVVLDFAARVGLTGLGPDDLEQHRSNVTFSREVSVLLGQIAQHTDLNVAMLIRAMIADNAPDIFQSNDCITLAQQRQIMSKLEDSNTALRDTFRTDLDTLFDMSDLADTVPKKFVTPSERLKRTKAAQTALLRAIGQTHASTLTETPKM
ncbi:MAG: hypothetical protein ABJN14_12740 [Paracoccaceae bacterium]